MLTRQQTIVDIRFVLKPNILQYIHIYDYYMHIQTVGIGIDPYYQHRADIK